MAINMVKIKTTAFHSNTVAVHAEIVLLENVS